MNSKVAVVTILLGCLVASVVADETPQSSWTNLVVNGSFELPALTSGANHVVPASELAPWQTAEDALLIWASNLPNEQGADGRQHAEVVSLWQDVPTVPGLDYRFSCYHAARPGVDSTLTISINGQVIRTFAENGLTNRAFQWRRFSTNFLASNAVTTIRFDGVGIPGNAHIDDVRLERLPLRSAIRVSEIEVSWESVATKTYQVQYKTALYPNDWLDLLPPIQGNGATNIIKDLVPVDEPRRFYRVITVP